ncbi:hypothetical protein KIW84_031171 [Lathyrus oleraceus]|uniref:Uncharacterized protein n=1 Tax=Pisum sativum TaxID=3888 RepID=A0A9D4XR78_PEA|nr:hypothetical protein KIW84_031171 [Pisum sativum]
MYYNYGKEGLENRLFGIPVVAGLSGITSGYDVLKEFLNLTNPFLMQNTEETIDEYDKNDDDAKALNEVDEFGKTNNSEAIESDAVLNSGAEDVILVSGRGNEVYKIT